MLHVKINERFISIKLIVQKYECSVCHHKSEEDYGDFVKKYYRISNEYARFLLNIFTEMRSFKAICKEYKISFNLANKLTRILVAVNNRANLITLPKHIGIDEFKGNLYKGYQKYQVQVTDLDTGDIIAVLKNKDSNTLANFFKQITNRDKVESVSIDFCSPFKKVVSKYFPHSKLIPDAFHRSKLLLSAVDEFRVELWRNYKSNKEYAKYFKGLKTPLMINKLNIKDEDYIKKINTKLDNVFKYCPDLKEVYELEQEYYQVTAIENVLEKINAFNAFLIKCKESKYDKIKSVAKTYSLWHGAINNSFRYKSYSNARTEGNNNSIKVLKRIAYGFRNFENFRYRLLASQL
jgi:transposase